MKLQMLCACLCVIHVVFGQLDPAELTIGMPGGIEYSEALDGLWDHDLIFYGYVHGTDMPQDVEAYLLIEGMKQGVRYYAPEVSASQAYFLNKYFHTGDEQYLHVVLREYIAMQDASVQWIEKYRRLRVFNETLSREERLIVIGTDAYESERLRVLHLTHLLDGRKTGDEMVDSLLRYPAFDEELHVWSGRPLWLLAQERGWAQYHGLYPEDSQAHFSRRFMAYYRSNTESVLGAFGDRREQVRTLLEDRPRMKREEAIEMNFEERVLPLIRRGAKVFSNYGYAHVLQARFFGYEYLAARLKNKHSDIKMYTVLTHLADSKVFVRAKFKKKATVRRYGKKIKLAEVVGVIHSTEEDGDTKKEKLLGIDQVRSLVPMGAMAVWPVSQLSPHMNDMRYFIDYEEGKSPFSPRSNLEMKTDDYCQGFIFIRGAGPGRPYLLE